MNFLDHFTDTIFQDFHDSDKDSGDARVYTEYDEAKLRERNSKTHGIYFTVNGFKGKRRLTHLTQINAVYADFDFAKEGDGQTQEQIDEKKRALEAALLDYLPPKFIIDTKNGLQPLWMLEPTEDQEKYVQALKGVRAWGKKFGSKADNVYDIPRVVRLPGFNHLKNPDEPYLCTVKEFDVKPEHIETFLDAFPYEEEEKKEYKPVPKTDLNPIMQAIERIPFQEIIIRAFASVGRPAEFDSKDRLVLDGRLTGTFQGKKDDRRFLASTSHEPYEGNTVTAVAAILACTTKEAYAWIVDEFNLSLTEETKKKKAKETVANLKTIETVKGKRFTWGTTELNETFAVIKPYNLIVFAGETNDGKSTYCTDMALKNAELGMEALYLSLEMSNDEVYDHIARKRGAITVKEEYYFDIPENKQKVYDETVKELEARPNFTLKGLVGNQRLTWAAIVEIIKQSKKPDIIFIDNFNLICKDDEKMNDGAHEKLTADRLLAYAAEKQTPLVVVHHFNKGKGETRTLDDMYGSSFIRNHPHHIVLLERNYAKPDEDPLEPIDKAALKLKLEKARSYDKARKTVYFHKGSFYDEFPDSPAMVWDNLNK